MKAFSSYTMEWALLKSKTVIIVCRLILQGSLATYTLKEKTNNFHFDSPLLFLAVYVLICKHLGKNNGIRRAFNVPVVAKSNPLRTKLHELDNATFGFLWWVERLRLIAGMGRLNLISIGILLDFLLLSNNGSKKPTYWNSYCN